VTDTYGPGLPVDSTGRPAIDPTENVKDTLEQSVRRLDDLRLANEEKTQVQLDALKEVAEVRAYYEGLLRKAESDRINAIRTVDTQAVQQAATVQATAATALQAQVLTSAETLRGQVQAAQVAAAATLQAAVAPLTEAISSLQRAQYEAQGQKTQVVEARSAAEDFKPILDALARLERVQTGAEGGHAQVLDNRAAEAARRQQITLGFGFVSVAIVVSSFIISNLVK